MRRAGTHPPSPSPPAVASPSSPRADRLLDAVTGTSILSARPRADCLCAGCASRRRTHGGRRAASTSPGVSATVTVRLPVLVCVSGLTTHVSRRWRTVGRTDLRSAGRRDAGYKRARGKQCEVSSAPVQRPLFGVAASLSAVCVMYCVSRATVSVSVLSRMPVLTTYISYLLLFDVLGGTHRIQGQERERAGTSLYR